MSNLIKETQDNIEFYTDKSTGESGMSVSGLARVCGVNKSSISRLIDSLLHSAPSECLQAFVGKDLTLLRSSSPKVIKDLVCAAVIAHYAMQGNSEAIKYLVATSAIGIRVYIQGITGYTSADKKHQQLRASTIITRRTLTEAMADYITRHNLSKTSKGQWLYKNATDKLYKLLFNHNAKKLKEILGAANPRDFLSLTDLRDLECCENLATRLIDGRDCEPIKAVEAAFNLQLLQVREIETNYLSTTSLEAA
ncbi:hypothetical protein [Nostoc sp. UHCC 0252]|uniref:hypothetical protein n=1 Tax=Nostoc sp. UHCC 0252 TaxID=3110241 RepID=UPI002B1F9095|nr:hypothetical protein [Nostoc sp. UHCC 0252]MEA5603724.1 hypothetical protein [Nostoc sp. UHCC 0252]